MVLVSSPFSKLLSAFPDLFIFSQVSFSRFIDAKNGNRKENFARFAEVRQKVADYLICSKDFDIITAIELDDRSHQPEKDKNRDALLTEAGIPTLRRYLKDLPSKTDMQNTVYELKGF